MKDLLSRIGQWTEKMWRSIPIHLRDAIFTALLLGIAAAICFVLRSIDENGSFTLLIFVLAVVIISRFTEGYFWGVFSSLFGVICVNFVFTYPFWAFNFRLTGYPLTFLTMLAVSLIISAMNTKIKKQERLRTEAERETMRANLLRAMSHDIRTPLIPVIKNYYPKKGERINLSYPILKLFITHTDIVIIFQHDIKSRLDHLSIHISMVC